MVVIISYEITSCRDCPHAWWTDKPGCRYRCSQANKGVKNTTAGIPKWCPLDKPKEEQHD